MPSVLDQPLPDPPDVDPPARAAVPRPRLRPRAEAVLSALLAAHVPVSLLLDLADPHGPCSAELLWCEPGSADWLHP